MKKLLCYLGIMFILALVLLPPALRIFLPDKKEPEKKVVVENFLLSCSNDEFMAITNYSGEKAMIINLKKLILEENYEFKTGKDLLDAFESLKDSSDALYKTLDDGELITIDYSVSQHPNLDMVNITGNSNITREFYEKSGLTCEVRK